MPQAPCKSPLDSQTRIAPLDQELEHRVVILDTAPHSLNQNGLLSSLIDPFPDEASEAPLAERPLQSNDDGFVLRCKLHHTLPPSLPVDKCQDVPANCVACCFSLSCKFHRHYEPESALDLCGVAGEHLIENCLNG